LDVNFPPINRARERQVFRARAESPNAAGGTSGLTDPLALLRWHCERLGGRCAAERG
jgi:hypothetical protein